jgi:hypothetical protein
MRSRVQVVLIEQAHHGIGQIVGRQGAGEFLDSQTFPVQK